MKNRSEVLHNSIQKSKTIRELWEIFEKNAIHPNTSELERYELEKAFYAGISSFRTMLEYWIKNKTDEEMINNFNALDNEMQIFAIEVLQGYGRTVAH